MQLCAHVFAELNGKMIKQALTLIRTSLDQNLKLRFGLNESVVVTSRIIDQDGKTPLINQNKVVITLLNVEQETSRQFTGRFSRGGSDTVQDKSPSERFNLDLMFTANFDDYEESLNFLDATIGFFQANTSVTQGTTSNVPKGVNKVNLDIETLNYTETYNLWSALGAKYVPSVVYKARLITIMSDEIVSISQPISNLQTQSNPNR